MRELIACAGAAASSPGSRRRSERDDERQRRRRRRAPAPRSPAGCPRRRRCGRDRIRGCRRTATARARARPRPPRRRATAATPSAGSMRRRLASISRPAEAERAGPLPSRRLQQLAHRLVLARRTADWRRVGEQRRGRREQRRRVRAAAGAAGRAGSAAAPARLSTSCRPSSAAASSSTPLARAAPAPPGAASVDSAQRVAQPSGRGPAASAPPSWKRSTKGCRSASIAAIASAIARSSSPSRCCWRSASSRSLARFSGATKAWGRAGKRIADRRRKARARRGATPGRCRDRAARAAWLPPRDGRIAAERRQQRRRQALDAKPGLGEAPVAAGAEVGHLREHRQQQGDRAGDRERLQPRGNGGEAARRRSRRARQGRGLHQRVEVSAAGRSRGAQNEGAVPAGGAVASMRISCPTWNGGGPS